MMSTSLVARGSPYAALAIDPPTAQATAIASRTSPMVATVLPISSGSVIGEAERLPHRLGIDVACGEAQLVLPFTLVGMELPDVGEGGAMRDDGERDGALHALGR